MYFKTPVMGEFDHSNLLEWSFFLPVGEIIIFSNHSLRYATWRKMVFVDRKLAFRLSEKLIFCPQTP